MPERRAQLVDRIARMVGDSLVRVVEARNGWPAYVDVRTSDGIVPLAAHVGTLGKSHRGRDDVERRFQNPGQGKPVSAPAGRFPVLLGLWEEAERPVLVAMDAQHRIGKETRQSLFAPLPLLQRAVALGWADQPSSTGELLIAFHPAMLPVYAESVSRGIVISPREVETVLDAAGLREGDQASITERARRATTQLVRDAEFGRRVCQVYGSLCAMCGFNFSLVEGAHIYPASAPDTSDAVWNGLSLCRNHHAAFDSHRLFVHPESRRIILHPEVLSEAEKNAACRSFVETTFRELAAPSRGEARPRGEMFERRYRYYNPRYAWAGWKP